MTSTSVLPLVFALPSRVASSESDGDSASLATPAVDISLVLRAQQGDRVALDRLVQQQHPAVARLLWRFAPTQADLDDLVQETFYRMLRGLPKWRAQQPFEHWLFRIATNAGRDYFRRQSVRARWQQDPSRNDGVEAPDIPDPDADPAARAAANEVKATLSHLPPDERALLTLYHLEGWGLKEIARHYGWTLTATKLRAWRARRRLRQILENVSPS